MISVWKFWLFYIGSIAVVIGLVAVICRVFLIDVPAKHVVLLSIAAVVIGAVCLAGIWSRK